jgi:hypothetical protein
MMCLWASYKKKYEEFFFVSLKSMKKGVGSGVGSGSVSQRYGSGDPNPHQNVTDLQYGTVFNYSFKGQSHEISTKERARAHDPDQGESRTYCNRIRIRTALPKLWEKFLRKFSALQFLIL